MSKSRIRLFVAVFSILLFTSQIQAQENEIIYLDESSFPVIDFSVDPSVANQELGRLFDEMTTAAGDPPNPGGIPVDGGLGILLAAGVTYGIRRMKKGSQKPIA